MTNINGQVPAGGAESQLKIFFELKIRPDRLDVSYIERINTYLRKFDANNSFKRSLRSFISFLLLPRSSSTETASTIQKLSKNIHKPSI